MKLIALFVSCLLALASCQSGPAVEVVAHGEFAKESPSHLPGQYLIYLNPNVVNYRVIKDSESISGDDQERIQRAIAIRNVQSENLRLVQDFVQNRFSLGPDQVTSVGTPQVGTTHGFIRVAVRELTAPEIEKIRRDEVVIKVLLNERFKSF